MYPAIANDKISLKLKVFHVIHLQPLYSVTCGGESGEGHVCACFVSDVSKVRRIMSNSNSKTATAAAGKLLSQYLATFLLELQTKVRNNFAIMEKAPARAYS